MRFAAIQQMTLVKMRELLREPEALFWVFVFPLLMTVGLGMAFRSRPPEPIPIAVVETARAEWIQQRLDGDPALRSRVLSESEARQELRTGRISLAVLPSESDENGWDYWFDETRQESRLARLQVDQILQSVEGRADAFDSGFKPMDERGSRYIDFLVPGLLGLNLMGTGMWGVGFSIVNARAKGLLKRLIATPMNRSDFLIAQLLGRMLFLFLEVGVLVTFARVVFDVPLRGSIVELGAACVLGAATFSGLGLLVASRARTIEGVSGLMNFVMMPMWILSGIYFSTSRFPDFIQPFIQALPLTAVIDVLRGIMLEGASLAALSGELAIVCAWCIGCYLLALFMFRWI